VKNREREGENSSLKKKLSTCVSKNMNTCKIDKFNYLIYIEIVVKKITYLSLLSYQFL